MTQSLPENGARTFMTILIGQGVSLFGNGLTGFAIAVWVYQETASVTMFSFVVLVTTVPGTLLSPLAGALIDRWDRRRVMILNDTGSALCSLGIALLLLTDTFELWVIMLLLSISSCFEAFQSTAYSTIVPLLVPKNRLGNYNGLIQLSSALPKVVAPALGGFLVVTIEMWGVILIDFFTYLVAFLTLLFVRIPKPQAAPESEDDKQSFLQEVASGWNYLKAHPGLTAILALLAVTYFTIGIVNVSFPALLLGYGSATDLGTILSLAGLGFVVGSIIMSVWGGPERRIYGVIGFTLLFGLGIAAMGLFPSAVLSGIGMFVMAVSAPLLSGCAQALWQVKVPTYLQGRVFALRDMVVRATLPLGTVIAGPLADRLLEPLLAVDGAWAESVGEIVGVGPGRGVGLMLVIFGLLPTVAALVAFISPRIRWVEDQVPDALPED